MGIIGGVEEMRVNFLTYGRIFFNRFRRNEKGATAMEYGLLVGLIAIAMLLGIRQVYGSINNMFETINTVAADAASSEG